MTQPNIREGIAAWNAWRKEVGCEVMLSWSET